jgi:hypothetical protein
MTPFDKEMRHQGYQLTRWALSIAAGADYYALFHNKK